MKAKCNTSERYAYRRMAVLYNKGGANKFSVGVKKVFTGGKKNFMWVKKILSE